MKVITPGHTYEVPGFENEANVQTIQSIHKEPIKEGSKTLRTVKDGTTNEDLLEILLDRMQFLQVKFPCRENAIAIIKLNEALLWLNKRTLDRTKRRVEGTNAS